MNKEEDGCLRVRLHNPKPKVERTKSGIWCRIRNRHVKQAQERKKKLEEVGKRREFDHLFVLEGRKKVIYLFFHLFVLYCLDGKKVWETKMVVYIKRDILEDVAIIGGLVGVQFVYAGNSLLLGYLMSLGLSPFTIIIFFTLSTFIILTPFAVYFER